MDYYNQITPEYIEALKAPNVFPILKIELMDYQEVPFAEIEKDISISDAGSISINYQQGVRRSCSITLTNEDGKYLPDANSNIWINSKFKIYTGIETRKYTLGADTGVNYLYTEQDDQLTTENVFDIITEDSVVKKHSNLQINNYWFSQGVYVLTNPEVVRDLGKKTISLNGVDKFGMLGSETNFRETDGTYIVPAGTKVSSIIQNILLLDLGNGIPLDNSYPIIDPKIGEETLPYSIEKSPEQYFAEILTELGNVFACDVFYDVDGHLNFVKGNETRDMDSYSSLWEYTDMSPEYFSVQTQYDFASVYNVIKVIGNNSTAAVYESVLKNTDLSSPTRVQLIGEKIKYVESSFCYSQERTNDFAYYLLRKYSIVQQSISFQSSYIPHLEVNNIITLTDEYMQYLQQRFVIQSITLPLSPNTLMDIEATNCSNIPYFEY